MHPEGEDEGQYAHLRSGRGRAAVLGTLWAAINSFVPAFVGAGVFAVASRYVTPADFGLVAFSASVAAIAGAFVPLGFGEALIQRQSIDRRHLDTVFWLCAATSLGIYAILVAAAWPISRAMGEAGLVALVPVVGAKIIFDLLAAVPNALLARAMSFNLIALRTTISALVAAAVCLFLLALGYGIWALALSQLASSIAACVGSMLSVSWRPRLGFDRSALADLRRYGLFASGNRVVQLLNVDQILIGSLLGMASLGLYAFARRIFQIVNDLIGGALTSVSYSLLASLQNDLPKLREAFLVATFASSALSFPVFIGLAAVAPDAVPAVFGAHWVEAVPALQGFCLIGLMTCVGILQSSLINSQGRADWWMYYQAVQLVLSGLVILAFYRYGIVWVVFAIAIKTWLTWPVTVVITMRLLDMRPRSYLGPFIAPIAASLAMLIAVLLIQESLAEFYAVARLAAEIGGGALVYAAALLGLARRRLLEIQTMVFNRGSRPV